MKRCLPQAALPGEQPHALRCDCARVRAERSQPERWCRPAAELQRFRLSVLSLCMLPRADRLDTSAQPSRFSSLRLVSPAHNPSQ